MLYYKVSAMFERNSLSEQRLDLLVYSEMIKNGYRTGVKLYYLLLFGGDLPYIISDLFSQYAIVDVNTVESHIQHIPYDC